MGFDALKKGSVTIEIQYSCDDKIANTNNVKCDHRKVTKCFKVRGSKNVVKYGVNNGVKYGLKHWLT